MYIIGDNTSETQQYDVLNLTKTSEQHETDVYVNVADDALSQRNWNAQALPDSSAIKRTEFADKHLASMADEDFWRPFQVLDELLQELQDLVAVVKWML